MAKLKPGCRMPEAVFPVCGEHPLTSEELFGESRGVLLFLRYAGCPLCCYDMHLLARRAGDFRAKGTRLAVVLQSPPESVRKMHGYPFGFPVICDPDKKLYRLFGVRPAKTMDDLVPRGLTSKVIAKGTKARLAGCFHGKEEGDEQQLPALFVIGPGPTVLAARYAENVLDLPDADGILALLDDGAAQR